jgi:hypothetical protein
MTRKEAAEFLCKRESWLRYAHRKRLITFVRVGQQVRYRLCDLEQWVESQVVPAGTVRTADDDQA